FTPKRPIKKRGDETRLCLDLFEQQAEKSLIVRAKRVWMGGAGAPLGIGIGESGIGNRKSGLRAV
ncbi:hypothetical protein AE923_22050, partial [Xanthomonas arboricola]